MKGTAVDLPIARRIHAEGGGKYRLQDGLERDLGRQIDRLPLEKYCQSGGWPLAARVRGVRIREMDEASIKADVLISFVESAAACCSGDMCENERQIILHLAASLLSGKGKILPPS